MNNLCSSSLNFLTIFFLGLFPHVNFCLFKIVNNFSMLILYSFLFQKPVEVNAAMKQDLRSFKLILEYIKALPVGVTLQFRLFIAWTTLILIVCLSNVQCMQIVKLLVQLWIPMAELICIICFLVVEMNEQGKWCTNFFFLVYSCASMPAIVVGLKDLCYQSFEFSVFRNMGLLYDAL